MIRALEILTKWNYTDGFHQRHHAHEQQNYISDYFKIHQQQFCAGIRSYDAATEMTTINVKNKFSVRDKLELILPEGNQDIIVERMEGYA